MKSNSLFDQFLFPRKWYGNTVRMAEACLTEWRDEQLMVMFSGLKSYTNHVYSVYQRTHTLKLQKSRPDQAFRNKFVWLRFAYFSYCFGQLLFYT